MSGQTIKAMERGGEQFTHQPHDAECAGLNVAQRRANQQGRSTCRRCLEEVEPSTALRTRVAGTALRSEAIIVDSSCSECTQDEV